MTMTDVGSSPSPTTYQLCDLGQITSLSLFPLLRSEDHDSPFEDCYVEYKSLGWYLAHRRH